MLYSKEFITKSTLLGIWKVEETSADLLASLSRQDWLGNFETIKSESRILEILAVRVLVKELTGEEKQICYNETGKPSLSDKSHNISISHTKGYVAVALNKKESVGLDIERISEKIRRVQSRVISECEYIDTDNDLIHMLLHWSAKEAMFKYLDAQGVDFRENLFVEKFVPQSSGVFYASENRTASNLKFNAVYRVEPDFVMVCLEAH